MIGRVDEISILEDTLSSGKPEFLALYGRRRVGKTYLIKEFFNNSFSFYATGIQQSNTKQQLKVFNEALKEYGSKTKTIPENWFDAFSCLRILLEAENVKKDYKSGRRVIFLDELPWMDTPRSDFKSALDYFWNSWGSSQKDLLLIVCGSATSWIINNIVKDNGGFYNRLTRQIRLMPFTLSECEQLLLSNGHNITRKQIVEYYMIFGGIPYYLNYLSPKFSLPQNVDLLLFNDNAPLKYEFQQLFSSLFRNSDQYVEIIKELSKHKSGLTRSELASKKTIKDGKELTQRLENLEQCGFIRKYHDFTKAINGGHFQLIDPLCLFDTNIVKTGKVSSWMDFTGSPDYYSWCGLAFEKVCLQHIAQIKNALGISGISSQFFSWKSKKITPGAQIDLLIDRKDDVINLCEIKYSKDEYVIDSAYEKELVHKEATFRTETNTKKALWITMISFSGIRKNEHYNSVQKIITGDELFT